MYTLNPALNRVATQIKQTIGRRNLINRELASSFATLLELLHGDEADFRTFLRNELGFTKTRSDSAWSLINLFVHMPHETTWKSIGQGGIQKLIKLNSDDRRTVVRWVNARLANNTSGYIAPTELNEKIIRCNSYPVARITKPIAERDALIRLFKELVESGKLDIDDVPVTKTVDGRRVALRALVAEVEEVAV